MHVIELFFSLLTSVVALICMWYGNKLYLKYYDKWLIYKAEIENKKLIQEQTEKLKKLNEELERKRKQSEAFFGKNNSNLDG